MQKYIQLDGETRKDYLLRVVVDVLKMNAYCIEDINYDDAESDAMCLAEDLEIEFTLNEYGEEG